MIQKEQTRVQKTARIAYRVLIGPNQLPPIPERDENNLYKYSNRWARLNDKGENWLLAASIPGLFFFGSLVETAILASRHEHLDPLGVATVLLATGLPMLRLGTEALGNFRLADKVASRRRK